MRKTEIRKEKFKLLLENKHYRRLHLYLYFMSILVIVIIYFALLFIFSDSQNYILTGVISMLIGTYLVYHRDSIVKWASNKIEDNKRRKIKKENKEGLKNAIKKIKPKKPKIDLNLKSTTSFKEKLKLFNEKRNKKPKKMNKKEYIEIK